MPIAVMASGRLRAKYPAASVKVSYAVLAAAMDADLVLPVRQAIYTSGAFDWIGEFDDGDRSVLAGQMAHAIGCCEDCVADTWTRWRMVAYTRIPDTVRFVEPDRTVGEYEDEGGDDV